VQAAAVCNETNDRAACYHVARQYENSGQYEHAISFFSRAQAYGNAVRLCKVSETLQCSLLCDVMTTDTNTVILQHRHVKVSLFSVASDGFELFA